MGQSYKYRKQLGLKLNCRKFLNWTDKIIIITKSAHMIDKTCPCRSSYEHSQRYFWTLTPKKGLLSCQLTFFRLVVTMAESFCFCTTANGAHAHLIYAEDNILWFIFTRGWSVFNTGGGSTLNIFKQKLSTSTTSNRLSLLECPELPSPLYSAVQSVVFLHSALERRQR